MTDTQNSNTLRVFITGGAQGLGFALAQHYVKMEAKVCIADIDDAQGIKSLEQLQAHAPESRYLHCDVRQADDLHTAAATLKAEWGGIDVVVNNAGVAQVGAIEDVTEADWQWIIDINLMGVVRGCHAFVPMMKAQQSGTIINVASMAGLLDVPMMSAYNSTKAAVVSLSETLHNELADDGIHVSVVCPSFFRTNLGSSMRTTVPGMHNTLDKLMSKSDLNAEDVAAFIVSASEKGHFYLLPHSRGRRIWTLKRWLPRAWYSAMIRKQSRGLRKK
ncbi:MAG: SDR family oxidoreductase [Idiomarina sp.]|nr:SDR family oxidoreductase [Idiomarina sp.]